VSFWGLFAFAGLGLTHVQLEDVVGVIVSVVERKPADTDIQGFHRLGCGPTVRR
jgi:hypothetical protein